MCRSTLRRRSWCGFQELDIAGFKAEDFDALRNCAAFYHQGRLSGKVADPAFARAFFAIWLDARTRVPALRARLLGQPS